MAVREKYAHLLSLGRLAPGWQQGLSVLCARHPIRLAYLFGSAVHAPEHAQDIDLAILPAPSFRLPPFYAELSELLGTDRLDLIELSQVPLWLREQIMRTGVCIYEWTHGERRRWEAAVRMLLREERLASARKGRTAMGLHRAFLESALNELQKVASELAKYQAVTLPELETNLSLRWTVERGLPAGLTLIFQMANHILAEHFGQKPETYEALLKELVERASSLKPSTLLCEGQVDSVMYWSMSTCRLTSSMSWKCSGKRPSSSPPLPRRSQAGWQNKRRSNHENLLAI